MPYPSQVDRQQIVVAAREIIAAQGIEALTLGRLAADLGVKAPSLYRYVANKTALLQAVNLDTLNRLFTVLDEAQQTALANPQARLRAVAAAYRGFAHANPHTYRLAMATSDDELRPDEDLLVQMIQPIQRLTAELVGQVRSLTALRGLLALMHGFVMLELNRQLRRGGDLNLAFQDSVSAYLVGVQSLSTGQAGYA
jgi:AcrR family transcriptional regulator